MENKTMDSIHRGLLKKYHTLCGLLGMTPDERQAVLAAYGVESSRDLDQHQLIDLCAKLSAQADQRQGKTPLDKVRKQAMAAIGGWLRKSGRQEGLSVIKGIACRATGYDDFNKIPRERLRNLVYLFGNKTRDLMAVEYLQATAVHGPNEMN